MPVQPAPRLRLVFLAATLFTFVTVVMGSMVAATDSSAACPSWPACYAGQFRPELVPTWLENPAIEMFHRSVSGACLVLLAAAGWLARGHRDVRLRVFPWIAFACAVAAAVFGMVVVLYRLPRALAMLDVVCALAAMVLIIIGTVAAWQVTGEQQQSARGRAAVAAVVVLGTMHGLGVLIAGTTSEGYRSFTRVISWPVWMIVELDHAPVLQVLRWLLAMLAVALIVLVVTRAWRSGVGHRRAMGLMVATVAELAIGLAITSGVVADAQTAGIAPPVAVTYAALAVTIVALASSLAAPAWPGPARQEPARQEPARQEPLRQEPIRQEPGRSTTSAR